LEFGIARNGQIQDFKLLQPGLQHPGYCHFVIETEPPRVRISEHVQPAGRELLAVGRRTFAVRTDCHFKAVQSVAAAVLDDLIPTRIKGISKNRIRPEHVRRIGSEGDGREKPERLFEKICDSHPIGLEWEFFVRVESKQDQ
jgi:hypothetical protein